MRIFHFFFFKTFVTGSTIHSFLGSCSQVGKEWRKKTDRLINVLSAEMWTVCCCDPKRKALQHIFRTCCRDYLDGWISITVFGNHMSSHSPLSINIAMMNSLWTFFPGLCICWGLSKNLLIFILFCSFVLKNKSVFF